MYINGVPGILFVLIAGSASATAFADVGYFNDSDQSASIFRVRDGWVTAFRCPWNEAGLYLEDCSSTEYPMVSVSEFPMFANMALGPTSEWALEAEDKCQVTQEVLAWITADQHTEYYRSKLKTRAPKHAAILALLHKKRVVISGRP